MEWFYAINYFISFQINNHTYYKYYYKYHENGGTDKDCIFVDIHNSYNYKCSNHYKYNKTTKLIDTNNIFPYKKYYPYLIKLLYINGISSELIHILFRYIFINS